MPQMATAAIGQRRSSTTAVQFPTKRSLGSGAKKSISSHTMPRFSLIRRREVWVPTIWGFLLLLTITMVAGAFTVQFVHAFLAPNAPAPNAKLLVVEGWMSDAELDQAVAAFQTGKYERVITTGGPIERWLGTSAAANYAELAATYLKKRGLADAEVISVPAPASAQDRTFLSAIKVREFLASQGLSVNDIDLFSAGTHARRSHMLYRMAFGPSVNVGVLSARPHVYDEHRWWLTSVGIKSVIPESISVIWTKCCFYPGPVGSHEEMWGKPSNAAR